jgi:hypothetical protein
VWPHEYERLISNHGSLASPKITQWSEWRGRGPESGGVVTQCGRWCNTRHIEFPRAGFTLATEPATKSLGRDQKRVQANQDFLASAPASSASGVLSRWGQTPFFWVFSGFSGSGLCSILGSGSIASSRMSTAPFRTSGDEGGQILLLVRSSLWPLAELRAGSRRGAHPARCAGWCAARCPSQDLHPFLGGVRDVSPGPARSRATS